MNLKGVDKEELKRYSLFRKYRNNICRNIKKIREQKELSQSQLAYHANLSPSCVSQIEGFKFIYGFGGYT
jgi:DNA-binding transcriptional regulator YiaG